MDVAVPRPYEHTETTSPSLRAHRPVQYSSPDNPISPPIRRFHEPPTVFPPIPQLNGSNLRSSDMDLTPAPLPLERSPQHSPWLDRNTPASLPVPNGQDHDRMETDVDSEGSESEEERIEHVEDHAHEEAPQESSEEMDITPDGPSVQDVQDSNSPVGLISTSQAVPTPAAQVDTPRLLEDPENARNSSSQSTLQRGEADPTSQDHDSPNPAASDTILPPPPTTLDLEPDATSQPRPQEVEQEQATVQISTNNAREDTQTAQGDNSLPTNNTPSISNNRSRENQADTRSQDDDSSEDEDDEFWADFKEDESAPDGEELRLIEENRQEVDASKHGHWESLVYEDLEDPEYIPTDSGHIRWTVHPVNGTAESPNKELIMRSPSVSIGGFYWNIKYYPRGNGGTEQMSVYIECYPDPPDQRTVESEVAGATPSEREHTQVTLTGAATTAEPSQEGSDNSLNPSAERLDAHEMTDENQVPPANPTSDGSEESLESWEVAAQIGCVVYNPQEPRVNFFSKSCHRYYIDNPDWGWTRFHGPWKELHKRQRFQRQPLLQNDTLVFTAYIRTVKDETKALWWHAPKDQPSWDSYERIGLQPLKTDSAADSAIIAAVSTWVHLVPFTKLIEAIPLPDPLTEPQLRARPLVQALQRLRTYAVDSPDHLDIDTVSDVVSWLDWYSTQTNQLRFDMPEVVAVWETLRRVINYEASNVANMIDANDLFDDILLLKQPDPWCEDKPLSRNCLTENLLLNSTEQKVKPRSVQETIDMGSAYPSKALQEWDHICERHNPVKDFPTVLHVELPRQSYDCSSRRWDKLTHQIKIDETVEFPSPSKDLKMKYSLFGMIVHAGALESNDYYSVLRPQGPGTRWLKYAGGNHKKSVSCLTTNQAIKAHEGSGDKTKGDSAVAYIVIYVRTNSLSTALLAKSKPAGMGQITKNETKEPRSEPVRDNEKEATVRVRVYKSSIFNLHLGRGLPDLWAARPILELDFVGSATIDQVKRALEDRDLTTKTNENTVEKHHNSFKLWCLDRGVTTARGLPRFMTISSKDLVNVLAESYEGCHLWLHSYYSDQPVKSTCVEEHRDTPMAEDAIDVDGSLPTNRDEQPDHGEREAMTENENTEEPTQTAVEISSPPTPGAGSPPPPPTNTMEQSRTTDAEDTVMDDAQDTVVGEVREPPPAQQDEAVPNIYFFVKVFNKETQLLCPVESSFAPCDSRVCTAVASLLGTNEPFDLYQEKSRLLTPAQKIRPSWTFYDLGVLDGCIFIVHHPPPAAESAALLSQAKHASPITYFNFLNSNDNPRYLARRYLYSYFGSPYYSLSMQNAFAHGPGIMISSSGDAYVGNFAAGHKSGAGTMAFSNQNTYTGEWADDEPEGQGKMLYGKTGNVYEGGWKKGRRHGKGVMRFEVADEELSLCKICYESEMDALFFDCGHVVACDECARQVDVCPVCRRKVRAVCKIWRT
ncbi:MAG: hypothetical protein Q9167_001692 [Letrouitia subvulpina]